MSAILDVVAGIRDLLEPDGDDETVDTTGVAPKEWVAGRLYCYPLQLAEVPFETSSAARQDFRIAAVWPEPSSESADRRRDPDISEALDEKLGRYLAAVRANATTALWGHIQAALRTPPRTLTTRSIAIEIAGWRVVS